MSLREIRSHTPMEIRTMLMALRRLNILREGQNITPEMIKQNPLLRELRNSYEEEAYRMKKYKEKHGESETSESDETPIGGVDENTTD